MRRYFFHVYDAIEARDEEGVELPDAAAAKEEAIRGARALACEQVMHGQLNLAHRIVVEDEGGDTVAVVGFADAIAVQG